MGDIIVGDKVYLGMVSTSSPPPVISQSSLVDKIPMEGTYNMTMSSFWRTCLKVDKENSEKVSSYMCYFSNDFSSK